MIFLEFVSHDEIYFTTKSAPEGGADSIVHDFIFRTGSDGGWLGRSIGLDRASPHSCGWAPYAVTHSRRKYHHPRMCLMASALPGAVCGAGVVRSFLPALPLLSGGISPRARRLASHTQNVSDCPIQLCVPDRPLRAVKVRIGPPFLIGRCKRLLKESRGFYKAVQTGRFRPAEARRPRQRASARWKQKQCQKFQPCFSPVLRR